MKKFFFMILLVSIFFTGLGSMLQETTAKFKSDEKALALLQKARVALGGENAIAGVNSLAITGKSTRTIKSDGVEGTQQGDLELALQFPDKMMKMVKIGHDDVTGAGEKIVNKQVDVVVVHNGESGNAEWKAVDGDVVKGEAGKKIVIKKDDGVTEEVQTSSGKNVIIRKVDGGETSQVVVNGDKQIVFDAHVGAGKSGVPRQGNELLRTSLALFLTAPQGMDVSYLYGGETNVDGTACNVIEAQFAGASIKLFLGKDSNLPVMMSYQGEKMQVMTFRTKKDDGGPGVGIDEKDVKVFTRKIGPPETQEFQVRFSDYRSTNGVLLPYRWTQTVGGQPDEIIDVTSYEINPANIADKFKGSGDTKVFMRKAKEQ